METKEKLNQIYLRVNENVLNESLLNYGCEYSEIIRKSIIKDDFVISIFYGIIKDKKSAVLRLRIYNYNTLNEIYFDGNVYNITYCENMTFEQVLKDCKKNLEYQIEKINKII